MAGSLREIDIFPVVEENGGKSPQLIETGFPNQPVRGIHKGNFDKTVIPRSGGFQSVALQKRTERSVQFNAIPLEMDRTDHAEIRMEVEGLGQPVYRVRIDAGILVQQVNGIHRPDVLESQIVCIAESEIPGGWDQLDFGILLPDDLDRTVGRGIVDNDDRYRMF